MRIVIADCSVIYTGRGDTKLQRATRALIIKEDGSVSVHNDAGTKPLNYMGKGNIHSVEVSEEGCVPDIWHFDTRKESLQVTMYQVFTETHSALDIENSALERDGTELHLQQWIEDNPEVLGAGWKVLAREYQTGAGPVDILAADENGKPVAVEVKRVAMLPVVDQAVRYVTALKEKGGEFEEVTGLIIALDIRPKTQELAKKRGVPFVEIPAELWADRHKEVKSE